MNSQSCILSKFYIKPQLYFHVPFTPVVVSYRNSTSNHNRTPLNLNDLTLYLIEILHQTTTPFSLWARRKALYLIEILHQTTTCGKCEDCLRRCILSKFYIKPQLRLERELSCCVVSYRNSTSNHNVLFLLVFLSLVVSYRNSTSNHNLTMNREYAMYVVSYRNSTSNHNCCR